MEKGKEEKIACSVCGHEVIVFEKHGEEIFCLTCYEDKFKKCYDCDEMIDIREGDYILTKEGEYYHDNCTDSVYYCERCEEWTTEEQTEVYKERRDSICVCDSCLRHYYRCNDCGEYYYTNDNGIEYRGEYVCQSCYEDNYFYCENCDTYFHNDEYGDNNQCRGCINEDSNENIKDHGYKPSPIFFPKKGLPGTRYYGIELEVEGEDKPHEDMAENINSDYLYCKQDGSLVDGFEIVSHPATFKELTKGNSCFEQWEETLDNLRKKGYTSYDKGTCGMHIHVSKSSLSSLTIYKMLTFFKKYKGFILYVSQRGEMGKLDSWSKIRDENNRDLIYCARRKYLSNRYTAINLQPDNTVEIRIFRGSLRLDRFLKNVEFIDSIIKFLEQSDIESTIENYVSYVSDNRKTYLNLFNFLQKDEAYRPNLKKINVNKKENKLCV